MSANEDLSRPYRVGDWTVDPSRGAIHRNGLRRLVQPRVLDLLAYLAVNAGRTVSRDELLAQVWGRHASDDVVWRTISRLREALDDDPRAARYVETVPRRGYRLCVEVGSVKRGPFASRAAAGSAAAAVAAALLIALGLGAWNLRTATPAPSAALPNAVAFYELGLDFYQRYQPDDLERAAIQFRRAIDIDDSFAPALAGLANTYSLRSRGWSGGPLALQAQWHAERAVALDPDLPEAYRSLGLAYVVRGWLERSMIASERALVLRPDWAAPMNNIATALAARGQLDRAVHWQRRAVDHAGPARARTLASLGALYVGLGASDEARRSFQRALDHDPLEPVALEWLAMLELRTGHERAAEEAIERLSAARAPRLVDAQAHLALARGDHRTAIELLAPIATRPTDAHGARRTLLLARLLDDTDDAGRARTLRDRSLAFIRAELDAGNERYDLPLLMALIAAGEADGDGAYEWLERAEARGLTAHDPILAEPAFSELFNEPRFEALHERVKNRTRAMRVAVLPAPTAPAA